MLDNKEDLIMLISRCIIDRITVDANRDDLVEVLSFLHKNGYWIAQEIVVAQLGEDNYYTIVAEKYSSQVHEDTDGSLDNLIDFFKNKESDIKWLPEKT